MAGIFGVALKGLGMLGKGKKVSKTISSVKPNVPKTDLEKAKSKLACLLYTSPSPRDS